MVNFAVNATGSTFCYYCEINLKGEKNHELEFAQGILCSDLRQRHGHAL